MSESLSSTLAFKRFFRYARPHRASIYRASSYSILNKLFDIAPELLIGVAVDVVVRREQSFLAGLGVESLNHQLALLGVLTFFIWAFESLFEYLYSIEWRNLAQTIQHEMRLESYDHVQKLDMGWFENQSTGGLLSVMGEDVNQLERFLNGGANEILQVGVSCFVIGAIFFYLSPLVALMAVLPIPVIIYGAFNFQKRVGPRYAKVRESAAALNGRLSNNIQGMATIKAFAREDSEREAIEKESQFYRTTNREAIKLSSAFVPIIRMAILAGFLCTLLVGGWLALQGRLEVGSYSALVFLTQRLLWPLTGLANTVDLYERSMASVSRILNLIETPVRIADKSNALAPKAIQGEIEFRDVVFGYEGREPLLQGLNLHVAANKTLALVGSTGAGKSTVVKLLLRFVESKSGAILLDGEDITHYATRTLRESIGFVSQDVFLFHGSVLENIAYGKPHASLEEIIEAAKAAEAHDFISMLPDGYHTLIGERGQKLSGGQRQRLSIARALLKDPRILILDEATSAVDNETEAAIQRSLEKICVGRTTLVIAHRLSTIRNADLICVMEHGKVIEHGTHEELLSQRGTYEKLWCVQTGENPNISQRQARV